MTLGLQASGLVRHDASTVANQTYSRLCLVIVLRWLTACSDGVVALLLKDAGDAPSGIWPPVLARTRMIFSPNSTGSVQL
ncbi:hypothetical protein BC835DRAFT_1339816 [Cytidiella melzeri]|nr:hypothetical protein BC835DRAFT_1339816 [Cytidiella melzeri]